MCIKSNIIKDALKFSTKKACIKQSVYARIDTKNGEVIFGMNTIENNVKICPRITQKCASGEGYHLCKEICGQKHHAEVDAIRKAQNLGIDLKGAKLTLVGHTYCCDNCKKEMTKVGINEVEILGLV